MKFYRTDQPEQAAVTLCAKYRLVMALQWLLLPKRMPLRQSEIKGPKIYHVRTRGAAEDGVRAWHKTGGLYIREYSGRPDYGATDAILRVEAPLNLQQLEFDSMQTTNDFVICTMMTWNPHRNALIDLFPPAEVARKFFQTLDIFAARRPRNLDLAMIKMMELPEDGVIPILKTEFYKKANLSAYQMTRIAAVSTMIIDQRRAQHYCTPVTLRFPPEDPDYLALFNWIEANCPKYMQYHIIRNGEPGEKFPYWKSWIRHMHYKGFMQREDEIWFWSLSGMKPDYEIFDEAHAKATKELNEAISYVEKLPIFPLRSSRVSKSAPAGSQAPRAPE